MVKNKKGWIKILEAFLAILMLLGILLAIMGTITAPLKDISVIERKNQEILSELGSNITFREEIIGLSPPKTQEDFSENLASWLEKKKLYGTTCHVNICAPEDECEFDVDLLKDAYVSSRLLFATKDDYEPKKVKILCYEDCPECDAPEITGTMDLALLSIEHSTTNSEELRNYQYQNFDLIVKNGGTATIKLPFKAYIFVTLHPSEQTYSKEVTINREIQPGETTRIIIDELFLFDEEGDPKTADVQAAVYSNNVIDNDDEPNNKKAKNGILLEVKVKELTYYDISQAGQDYAPENLVFRIGSASYPAPVGVTYKNLKICTKDYGCYEHDLKTKPEDATQGGAGGVFNSNGWTLNGEDSHLMFKAQDLFGTPKLLDADIEFTITGLENVDDVFIPQYDEETDPNDPTKTISVRAEHPDYSIFGMHDYTEFSYFERIDDDTCYEFYEGGYCSYKGGCDEPGQRDSNPGDWDFLGRNPFKAEIWTRGWIYNSQISKLRVNVGDQDSKECLYTNFECWTGPDSLEGGNCVVGSDPCCIYRMYFNPNKDYTFRVAFKPGAMFYGFGGEIDTPYDLNKNPFPPDPNYIYSDY